MLSAQNSSANFQMYLCFLEDVVPSVLDIGESYRAEIRTDCRVDIKGPAEIVNGSSVTLKVEY